MNTNSSKSQQHNGKPSGLRRMIIKLSRKLTLIVTWRPRARVSRLLAMLLAASSTPALALPGGEQVVSGNISVARSDSASMTVTQTSDKGIINWNSYGIGAGEAVNYLQPSASSVTFNRVVGGDASQIFGQLSANGQIFLINPNGVLFAPGAQVDVGGLVASTLGIGDDDFLAGRYTFQNAGGAGSVVNQGSLSGKYIALIAPNIDNSGSINANGGTAALAAGDRVSLDLSGDGLLQVSVDAAAAGARIQHSGAIVADGGKVFITAKSADALMDTVLNVSGLVRAQSLSEVNGVIRLEGGNTGVVSVSGSLDVSGNKLGESGGSIAVLGDKVGLFDGARLDASGYNGGGSVLVGGNYQGQGPEQNASMTYVAAGASIDASATGNGDGGTVIVYASDTARIHGSLSARGGYLGGNGGFIETSGKRGFEIRATPDVTAASGLGGTWLIDPNNIEIVAGAGTTNINVASPFLSTNDTAQLGIDLIIAALTGGANVSVTTGTGGTDAEGGDITLTANLDFNGTGTNGLTFSAHNDIILNGSISDGTPGGDVLNLILTANSDSTGTGSVLINNTLNTGGGSLTASGVSITATGAVTAAATNLTASTGDISFSNAGNNFTGAVSSAGVNVTLVDTNAIDLGASTVTGNLSVTAGGLITDSNILDVTGTTTLNAAGFDITLNTAGNDFTGAVSSTGASVTLVDTNAIDLGASTATGNLSVTATAGSITDSGNINVTGAASFNATGNITLGDAAETTNFGSLNAATSADNNIDISEDSDMVIGDVSTSGTGTVRLSSTGTLNDSDDIGFNITAQNAVTLIAPGGIGTTSPIQIGNIASLALTTAGSFNVSVNGELSGLSMTLDPGSAANTYLLANGGLDSFSVTDGGTNLAVAISDADGLNLTVNTTGALDFGATNIGTGNLLATATTGNITDSGTVTVSGTASFTTSEANADIDLGTLAVTGALSLNTNGATGNATVVNATALDLGTSSVGGNLLATATTGNITDSGTVTVGGTAGFTTSGANADIDLGSLAITGTLSLNTTGATGNATVVNATALDLGASSVGGNLLATATTGNITDSGTVTVGGTAGFTTSEANADIDLGTLAVTGSLSLNTNGATGNATVVNATTLDLAISSVGGDLLATATTGNITDSGNISVTGNSTFTANTGGSSITLDSAGNAFTGSVAFASSGVLANVTIVDTTALILQALTLSGNLSVTAAGITDSGVLSITGVTSLTAGPGNDITLDAANNFGGAVSVVSGNNVTLNDINAIDLGASSISGNLVLTTAGAITDSGVLSVTGTTSLTAGSGNNITLDAANNFGGAVSVVSGNNVTLNDINAIDLGASTISGNLVLTTAGATTDSGVLSVTGTTSLTAGSGNNITLDAANNFGGAVSVVSGNNVTLNDTGVLVIGDFNASGNVNLVAGGTLNFTKPTSVGGSLTASSATFIDAYSNSGPGGAALAITGASSFTAPIVWLDNLAYYQTGSGAVHDFIGPVSINAGGGSIFIADKNDLEIDTIIGSYVNIGSEGGITNTNNASSVTATSRLIMEAETGIGSAAVLSKDPLDAIFLEDVTTTVELNVHVADAKIALAYNNPSLTFTSNQTVGVAPYPDGTLHIPLSHNAGNVYLVDYVRLTNTYEAVNVQGNQFFLCSVVGISCTDVITGLTYSPVDLGGILNAASQDLFNANFGTDNIRVAIQNGFLTQFGVVPPGIDAIDGDGVNVPAASLALVIDPPPFLIDEEELKRRSLPK